MRLDEHLARWDLVPDGDPIVTDSSRLLPVRRAGAACMLKVAVHDEERQGAALMRWWGEDGAARVLAHEDDALLLERAGGGRSLTAMARGGRDDDASRIVCGVAARLHRPRAAPLPPLVPLCRWFSALAPAALHRRGILALAASAARRLLDEPRDAVALHGDLHHANVLDGGPRGWLAIDPKGLEGERGFDLANLFCNPDAATALAPGRLARQAAVVAAAAGVERRRLLCWILAWAGLSAAWILAEGEPGVLALGVARIAPAELGGSQRLGRARVDAAAPGGAARCRGPCGWRSSVTHFRRERLATSPPARRSTARAASRSGGAWRLRRGHEREARCRSRWPTSWARPAGDGRTEDGRSVGGPPRAARGPGSGASRRAPALRIGCAEPRFQRDAHGLALRA